MSHFVAKIVLVERDPGAETSLVTFFALSHRNEPLKLTAERRESALHRAISYLSYLGQHSRW